MVVMTFMYRKVPCFTSNVELAGNMISSGFGRCITEMHHRMTDTYYKNRGKAGIRKTCFRLQSLILLEFVSLRFWY